MSVKARTPWLLFAAFAAGSCVFDASEPCGVHQELQSNSCVCSEGYGMVGQECVACSDDEVGNPIGPCACAEGLVRAGPDQPCVGSQGSDCLSDSDCDEDFPHCRLEDDTGYCTTQGCTAGGDDCSGTYGCNDREDVAYCERAPQGLGESCSEQSDCSSNVADFCETFVSNVCVVDGCADDPSICHGDWVCCDIELLGNSLCVPPSDLEDGACPVGGTLVPRTE